MFTTSTIDCVIKKYITCVQQNFVVRTTACALVAIRYVRQRSSYYSCNNTPKPVSDTDFTRRQISVKLVSD